MNDLKSPRLWITAVILCATLAAAHGFDERRSQALAEPLESIPMQIGCWEGVDLGSLGEGSEAVLKADSYISRSYDCENRQLGLFMAYYGLQQAGESMHSPKNCLPGSGWEIWDYAYSDIEAPNGETVSINKYYVQHGTNRIVVYYWYQNRKRIVASEYTGKLCLIWDSITTGNTEGSIVRVTLPDAPWSDDVAEPFIRQLIGSVARVMPGESRFDVSAAPSPPGA